MLYLPLLVPNGKGLILGDVSWKVKVLHTCSPACRGYSGWAPLFSKKQQWIKILYPNDKSVNARSLCLCSISPVVHKAFLNFRCWATQFSLPVTKTVAFFLKPLLMTEFHSLECSYQTSVMILNKNLVPEKYYSKEEEKKSQTKHKREKSLPRQKSSTYHNTSY